MRIQFTCYTAERRQKVKESNLNAIDYLEVLPRTAKTLRPLLLLYCLRSVLELSKDNVLIEGGVRVNNVKIIWANAAKTILENLDQEDNEITKDITDEEKSIIRNIVEPDRVLLVRPDSDGDFSIYTLQLIQDQDNRKLPPVGFDSILSQVDFSFKVQCPTDFDCKEEKECLPQTLQEPVIDYMAKDYASFRRLMLDRLTAIMPEWKERNPADMNIMLVELLAYVGDHLSYFQDAVATEAYLGTARRRVSVKRHARLVNYFMHEGCNARVWIYMGLSEDSAPKYVPEKTMLLTGSGDQSPVVMEEDLDQILNKGEEVFETMNAVTLYKHHNEILFYTWDERRCCLPGGATRATIRNDNSKFDLYLFSWKDVPGSDSETLKNFLKERFSLDWIEGLEFEKIDEGMNSEKIFATDEVHHLLIELCQERMRAILTLEGRVLYKFTVKQEGETTDLKVYDLTLKIGDYLLFEEVRSPLLPPALADGLRQNKTDLPLPSSSSSSSPNPSHRHIVRLTEIESKIDELNGTSVIDIAWDEKDALPFALCLWELPEPVSIARGNIVLADHGKTIRECLERRYVCGKLQPRLLFKPLTHRGPFDPYSPASSVFKYEMQDVVPDIYIEEYESNIADCKRIEEEDKEPIRWHAVRDLLSSDRFRHEFVIEVENDGTAQIRFGDNIMGLIPEPSTQKNPRTLCAVYRVGNGRKGNVGADKINRIVRSRNFLPDGIENIRNPLAAQGGTNPETLEEVRQYSPQAFRKQERAVTESDYVEVLKRHPDVQKATAVFRWFGSWYTVLVTIDRFGGKKVDAKFRADIRMYLEKYRLAGLDLEINEPRYVPLYIRMNVCVAPNYFRDTIKRELIELFSNRNLPDGRMGFFHPDNFTFGQPVYLSKIYEAAMKVKGISSVSVIGAENFRRLDRSSEGELDEGVIRMESSEIARLDSDRNFPDNGKIEFNMEGGQ